jgi:hypothetical protein
MVIIAVSPARPRKENLDMEDPRMLWLTITNVASGVVVAVGLAMAPEFGCCRKEKVRLPNVHDPS